MQGDRRISDWDLYWIAGSDAVFKRNLAEGIIEMANGAVTLAGYGLYYGSLGLYYAGVGVYRAGNHVVNYLENRQANAQVPQANAQELQANTQIPQAITQEPAINNQPENPVWLTRYFSAADLNDEYNEEADADYGPDIDVPQTTHVLRSSSRG